MRFRQSLGIVIWGAFLAVDGAAIPDWAKSTTGLSSDNKFSTVCSGVGPSVDLARTEALQNCKTSAAQFFSSRMKVKTIAIETEKDVIYHKETNEEFALKNVSCRVNKEEIEKQEGGGYEVWVLCLFDLNRIQQDGDKKAVGAENRKKDTTNDNLDKIEVKQSSQTLPQTNGYDVSTEKMTVSISSVPMCTDLLITGEYSRSIKCASNPVSVIVHSYDKSILVRASGYLPKEISLETIRGGKNGQILVILNRN